MPHFPYFIYQWIHTQQIIHQTVIREYLIPSYLNFVGNNARSSHDDFSLRLVFMYDYMWHKSIILYLSLVFVGWNERNFITVNWRFVYLKFSRLRAALCVRSFVDLIQFESSLEKYLSIILSRFFATYKGDYYSWYMCSILCSSRIF